MDLKFSGKVEKGIILLDDPKGFKKYTDSFEGKFIELILRKYKTKRSNEQNRYYWGVVINILGNEFGYDPDEMHEALKWLFLKKRDRKIPTVGSTTKLTTTEFSNYIEKIQRWAITEHNIEIPDPEKIEV